MTSTTPKESNDYVKLVIRLNSPAGFKNVWNAVTQNRNLSRDDAANALFGCPGVKLSPLRANVYTANKDIAIPLLKKLAGVESVLDPATLEKAVLALQTISRRRRGLQQIPLNPSRNERQTPTSPSPNSLS